MAFTPVISREMGVLARRNSTYWARAATAIIAVLTMFWVLVVSASRVSFAEIGSSIFLTVSGLCFAFVLLVGMQATSDSVSEEKREGTLGLLFLTDLRGQHILAGKLVAGSLNSFYAVLGVVPMLSLAMLLGGVTLGQIGLVALVLTNTMFLSLSTGLLVSTLSKNERKAMLACLGVLFLLTIFPFVASFALSDFETIHPEIVCISPLYSFICLQNPGGSFDGSFFSWSLIAQQLLAWAFLGTASVILPRCIHELPSKRFVRWRTLYENYLYGREEQRKRYRAELLDRNAFLWLASRERVKAKYAWFILGFFAAMFVWVAWEFPGVLFDSPIQFILLFLLHFVLKAWTASEVCSRLINDRRSGALELLLSSSLSVREIAHGQTLALARLFRKPIFILCLGEVLLGLVMVRHGRSDDGAQIVLLIGCGLSSLLLDLWALKWVGMWLSLFGKSIERVLIASLGRLLAVPWIIFAAVAGSWSATAALQNEQIPARAITLLWLAIAVLTSAAFGISARLNFLRHFREVAAEQLQARPAKFKSKKKKGVPGQSPIRALQGFLREHWVIAGGTAFVLLIFSAGLGRQLYWKHRLNSELARVRSLDEPVNGQELARYYPKLSSNEDGFALLNKSGAVNYGKWIQPSLSGQLLAGAQKRATNTLPDCRRLVAANQPQLGALKELRSFDKAYLDPSVETSWMLPVDLNGYSALAAADLILAIDTREPEHAAQSLFTMLKLAELERSLPIAAIQDQCSYILAAFTSALEYALNERLLSSADLTSLQYTVERLAKINVLQRTLAVERARTVGGTAGIVPPAFGFRGQVPLAFSVLSGFSAAIGSRDRALVMLLEQFRGAMELLEAPRPQLIDSVQATTAGWSLLNSMFGLGPAIGSIVFTDTLTIARLRLITIALATERFRKERGHWPPDMIALVPVFLDRVPLDPFSDEPFECVHQSGKFLIQPSPVTPEKRRTTEKLAFEFAAPNQP